MENEFNKLKITTTPTGENGVVDEENKKDEEEGSKPEITEGEGSGDAQPIYDKAKSFFDNISCEASERQQGKRPNWRQERALNMDTFGQSSVRRRGGYGYGYRGRGGYMGRGRGGPRGYYRGRGGYNRYGGFESY